MRSIYWNPDRFYANTTPEPNTGCHLWTGVSDHRGYGRVRVAGHSQQAHRAAWQLANGVIPNGLHVLHRCDTPACVNVDHLFLGTDADNARDMVRKGRRFDPMSRKTECPKGHPYSGDNLYIKKSGNGLGRVCRVCKLAGLKIARRRRVARAAS